MTKLNTLKDGLLEELKDLYSAENQLIKALPKMEKKATCQKLKEGFHAHLLETEGQLERLNEIAMIMNEKLSGKTCKAMQGLIEEGKEVIEKESENKALIDALLIGAARRVEHYEIAAYCTARAMAIKLELNDVAKLLAETLKEEGETDKKLFTLLEGEVVPDANSFLSVKENNSSKNGSVKGSYVRKNLGNSVKALMLLSFLLFGNELSSTAQAESGNLNREKSATQYKSDNTGRNIRDRNTSQVTADDQSLAGSDLNVLAQIRREIVANDTLSTNAHNVKIIVENGKIVLRGPVKSEQEKSWIEKTTSQLALKYVVVSELEVSPS